MKPLYFLLFLFIIAVSASAQVYQGLVVPDNKGRFSATGEITQASGLALDTNNHSFWTHNDQGNAPLNYISLPLPAAIPMCY